MGTKGGQNSNLACGLRWGLTDEGLTRVPGVVIVAATTGYQTRAFAEAARRLGLASTLATDRCHILENPWGDHAIPVRFEHPSEAAHDLAEALREREITGIVAVADRPAVVAALTARHLGLPWHSPEAAKVCRDKHRMRVLFEAAGLLVPHFIGKTLN